ncbi:MAG: indole-3-glycerol-phosphate synthase [Actinobacteria bacterium]|nr:indole-3-glycerol-phosphate synthase [Actinomycetota bacterium]
MYLESIVAQHRAAAARDDRSTSELIASCQQLSPTRGFASRLRSDSRSSLAVIAEVKRKSPSKGDLWGSRPIAPLVQAYVEGGASCLSVLTDVDHFGGSPLDLTEARSLTSLPVLRKDFTVSLNDVVDARLMGADCVLLIAAVLSAAEMADMVGVARDVGIDVLIETHDEEEVERSLDLRVEMIGVNQRDLVTFEVDHERALRMASVIPSNVVRIAESGVRNRSDAEDLRRAGFDAVLVGESLLVSNSPTSALADLRVK